ncbi:MAG: transposase [Leptolyngbyaceae cyanobacterium HOT.MB2.61]|nr:transposase [Leptolyngbyaceae cyanobacterium HOT.MB2.61]
MCKRWLDVHLRPQHQSFRVSNTESGIRKLLTHLCPPEAVGRVMLESTGGYERQVALVLSKLAYPVVVMNARPARNFAKAANQLAKPDQVDAAILAWFGEAMKPPIRSLASEADAELQDLVTRRRQLVDILTAEQNRLSGLRGTAQADIEAHIEWLRERIQPLDEQIDTQISQCQHWQANQTRLTTVPGVDKVVAATLLALLPELGQLSTRKISRAC